MCEANLNFDWQFMEMLKNASVAKFNNKQGSHLYKRLEFSTKTTKVRQLSNLQTCRPLYINSLKLSNFVPQRFENGNYNRKSYHEKIHVTIHPQTQ